MTQTRRTVLCVVRRGIVQGPSEAPRRAEYKSARRRSRPKVYSTFAGAACFAPSPLPMAPNGVPPSLTISPTAPPPPPPPGHSPRPPKSPGPTNLTYWALLGVTVDSVQAPQVAAALGSKAKHPNAAVQFVT